MMLDDGVGIPPTKVNIMAVLENFLVGQRPGDLFVFVFAGHAKQEICLNGTERDGKDEFIITSDPKDKDEYITILDDVLHDNLVKPLSPGCSLVAFLDACHSETLLDLNHHVCNRPARARRVVRRLRELTGFPAPTFVPGQMTAPRFCSGLCPRIDLPTLTPNVICFSACKDSEMVYEAVGNSMLDTVIRVLEADPSPSLKTLRRTLNESAREIYRKAKLSNKRRDKGNVGERQLGLRTDDESCCEDMYQIKRWAPQISSMMPLRMDRHLKL
ncbi:caspase domain-containing protein [Mycena galopus ATCC 62051]|nr:caspase domain-containing protein [Mycena galopus ATCC 62051]